MAYLYEVMKKANRENLVPTLYSWIAERSSGEVDCYQEVEALSVDEMSLLAQTLIRIHATDLSADEYALFSKLADAFQTLRSQQIHRESHI